MRERSQQQREWRPPAWRRVQEQVLPRRESPQEQQQVRLQRQRPPEPGRRRRQQVRRQIRRGWKQELQQAPAAASSRRARPPGPGHQKETGSSKLQRRKASALPAFLRQQDGAPEASPGGRARLPVASDGRPSSRRTATPARTRWRKGWWPGLRRQRRKGSWREALERSLPGVRKYRGCCSWG